jgi:mono/diheme cytochrome c family protein
MPVPLLRFFRSVARPTGPWRGLAWVAALAIAANTAHADLPGQDASLSAPGAEVLEPAPTELNAATQDELEPAVSEQAIDEVSAHDDAARVYMMKCMGCHTIGGGMLSGPDLKNLPTYPRQTVVNGIWRMEQQVGPLSEDEVEMLTDLLMDPGAATRLDAQRERVQLREAATMEPPNAAIGEALYFGRTAFANRGLSCAACHQAGGRGGNLASSLEDSYTRLGAESLLSTTENPGFPVMRAIYEKHPITRQEALHLVAYLEVVAENPAAPFTPPLHLAGIVGALGLMAVLGRKRFPRAAGTRARLVMEANRRGTQPHSRERGTR